MASTIKEYDHLRIPLEDIVKATTNFADENIIGKGGLGNVYKGQLARDGELLDVSVRRFDCKDGWQGSIEFLTEIKNLSTLEEQYYVASMIGFCEERGEKIIVYSYQANRGSLMMHLSDPVSFTWHERIKLSLQVAKAIRYLHSGKTKRITEEVNFVCDLLLPSLLRPLLRLMLQSLVQSLVDRNPSDDYLIIHRNINSSTILLDEYMFPRLSGFEYSIQQSLDRKEHIFLCKAIGTRGYIDLTSVYHGGVIHKTDVYSFGIVLFEILCGREAYQDNKLLVKLAKFHYKNGTLQDIILPDLWKQMDPISFKHFSEAAYSCLITEWTKRPDIDQVLDKLEKALAQDHIQQEESLNDVETALPNYKNKNLENKTPIWEEQLKMCIDNANELNYLHNEMEVQKMLIHDGENIVLDECNLGANIVGYRKSVFNNEAYMDPEFLETGILCKESDVFGFGVVMLEMLCGHEARELLKLARHEKARTLFNKNKIKRSFSGVLLGGNGDSKLYLNRVPNEDSLSIFLQVAFECVEKKRNERPTMKVVIQELHKALTFQNNYKDNFGMSFEDIRLATQNFSDDNMIGKGGFGGVYIGKLADKNGKGCFPIVAKKLNRKHGQGDKEFYTELQILCEYKHENIIGLVGYNNEMDEKIIVYEHASKGSLDKHLNDASLTWRNRLKICIDFATGLDFLHEGREHAVIHRDIKSFNILLFDDWKAKIGDFGLSMICVTNNYTIDIVSGTTGYVDPMYSKSNLLTKESDIYSFGVVLFEILCGKAIHDIHKDGSQSLLKFIELNFEEGNQANLVIKAINEEIVPNSLATFLEIVYRCLDDDRESRPSSKEVLEHLQRALNFQDQGEIFRMSLDEIQFATQNFSLANEIERGYFGRVYKGEYANKDNRPIVVKKFNTSIGQWKKQYYNEFQILCEYKHENIIGLVGYVNEMDGKILVYERASKGSLDMYLSDASLTWKNRLKICIDFAIGLNFLHEGVDGKEVVIHKDIKSSNILLFDDWKVKIGGFGLSSKISKNTNCTIDLACNTSSYIDPVYKTSCMLTIESDIYSFGVVLFEILHGKAIHEIQSYESQSLLSFIEHNFEKGKQDELVLKAIDEEIVPNSLVTFLDIVYRCLHDDRESRPSSKEILEHLERALNLQVQGCNLNMSLDDINFATRNFNLANEIERGNFMSVYKGEFANEDSKTVVVKKFNTSIAQGKIQYYNEFQVVFEYKHENITNLLGFANEMSEKILVYEHASKGSLDNYLSDASFTWMKRLEICIDFATGLNFLHEGVDGKEVVIHKDIKSSNIHLFDDWKVKIGGFGLSSKISKNTKCTIDLACNIPGYLDPVYKTSGMLTIESDIYSFGVVLFEILCGKTIYEIHTYESQSLLSFIRNHFEEGKQDDLVFKAIDEEIVPNSLATFLDIVYRCLHDDRESRPSIKEVLELLQRALNFQVHGGSLRMSLDDINFATQNFNLANEIERGNTISVYKGKFVDEDSKLVIAKKFNTSIIQGKVEYCIEFQIALEYKHENITSLVGYVNEMDQKILVYEYASKGSLDKYLSDVNLTWMKRLEICIDFATGLNFLHEGVDGKDVVIHRDIKSSNILLFDYWKAKVGGFGLSSKLSKNTKCVIDLTSNTSNYVDPVYKTSSMLTIESDIYSFGVVLFEILCGKLVHEIPKRKTESLLSFIKHNFKGKQQHIVFRGIKEEIKTKSLTKFLNILYQCLDDDPRKRPSSKEVLQQLRGDDSRWATFWRTFYGILLLCLPCGVVSLMMWQQYQDQKSAQEGFLHGTLFPVLAGILVCCLFFGGCASIMWQLYKYYKTAGSTEEQHSRMLQYRRMLQIFRRNYIDLGKEAVKNERKRMTSN